jgi:hypothetical protein
MPGRCRSKFASGSIGQQGDLRRFSIAPREREPGQITSDERSICQCDLGAGFGLVTTAVSSSTSRCQLMDSHTRNDLAGNLAEVLMVRKVDYLACPRHFAK